MAARGGKRGNKRDVQRLAVGAAANPCNNPELVAAATALARRGGPTDMGSLYYVLGTQGSSQRVRQLHSLLHSQPHPPAEA